MYIGGLILSLHWDIGKPHTEGEKKLQESKEMKDTRRPWTIELTMRALMVSKRLKWQAQGLHGSAPGPHYLFYGLTSLVFL